VDPPNVDGVGLLSVMPFSAREDSRDEVKPKIARLRQPTRCAHIGDCRYGFGSLARSPNMIVASPQADLSADARNTRGVDAPASGLPYHSKGVAWACRDEQGPHSRRERDCLERTRENTRALRAANLVVILPSATAARWNSEGARQS